MSVYVKEANVMVNRMWVEEGLGEEELDVGVDGGLGFGGGGGRSEMGVKELGMGVEGGLRVYCDIAREVHASPGLPEDSFAKYVVLPYGEPCSSAPNHPVP
ncbi:hypothetical protein CYMTET_27932 [Cymbomonas tetramitiformis]|uniref:Uncharacterized protein n=1 Tax=Cymbomonas tetramitiformis TaxID=36881 RepID=A0AAE0KWG0_9CHLO|nr:hypothetical protein CYMTET_27932 [Cymbomonas tetramitiformis]